MLNIDLAGIRISTENFPHYDTGGSWWKRTNVQQGEVNTDNNSKKLDTCYSREKETVSI